jgi:hypothetical protein
METFELIFQIKGEPYRQVHQYRQEMDLRVIQNQIARRGYAILISLHGQHGFDRISELPALGEAVPWYGNVDSAYRYTCHPEPAGCGLRVENMAGGHSMFCAEVLPALELHLVDEMQIGPAKPPAPGRSPFPRTWIFREEESLQRLTLTIPPDLTAHLATWKWWGERLPEYEFIFTPSSIGTAIQVRHLPSGENLDLTKDANW